jgi:kynurenine formamidase
MVGTYLDLPGHIRETDDGLDAAGLPLEGLYRVEASVLHMDRGDGSGGVSGEDLERAGPGAVPGGALVINALGARRFDEVAFRSVWLETSAVRWIRDSGVRLLVSDIYESPGLHGVFYDLFRAGISTVCHPVDLHRLSAPRGRLTVLPVRIAGVTQLPCRVVAEWE